MGHTSSPSEFKTTNSSATTKVSVVFFSRKELYCFHSKGREILQEPRSAWNSARPTLKLARTKHETRTPQLYRQQRPSPWGNVSLAPTATLAARAETTPRTLHHVVVSALPRRIKRARVGIAVKGKNCRCCERSSQTGSCPLIVRAFDLILARSVVRQSITRCSANRCNRLF